MTAQTTDSQQPKNKAVERFRYDLEDTNYDAVARQRQQEARAAQAGSKQGKAKRKSQESAAALALREALALPLTFEFRLKHYVCIGAAVVMMVLYIYNGYVVQGQLVRISRLQDSLDRTKFESLSISSELMRRTRKSEIHKFLNQNSDSTFEATPTPPYVID